MFQPFKSFNRYAQLNLFPRRVAGEDEVPVMNGIERPAVECDGHAGRSAS